MPAHARSAVVSMEARYTRLMAEGKEAEASGNIAWWDPQVLLQTWRPLKVLRYSTASSAANNGIIDSLCW